MSLSRRSALVLLAGAVVGSIACGISVGASGCASFDSVDEGKPDGGNTGEGADGSADGGNPSLTLAKRDLTVVVEWPATALDPSKDPRLSKITITLADAYGLSPSRKVEATNADRGPYAFPQFESTSLVDASVELRGSDDRLIGFGYVARADVSATSAVTAVARKRLLYAARGDGNVATDVREVVAIDMAPGPLAEPGMNVLPDPLIELPWVSSLVLSPDARLLAIAHANGSSPDQGGITILETATHQSKLVVSLPFVPGEMIALGQRDVLVAPGTFSNTTAMMRVNLDTGAKTNAPSGLQGGTLDVVSAALTLDGTKVFVVGNRQDEANPTPKPYLIEFDVATNKSGTPVPIAELDRVTAARFTRGGETLIVLGWTGPDDSHCTGRILTYAYGRGAPTYRMTMDADVTRPSRIVVHPSGKRFFVSNEQFFANSTAKSGEFYVLDEAWNVLKAYPMQQMGPQYGVESAVHLPYDPFRVIAGQTDPANNYHGSIVDLPGEGFDPSDVTVTGYTVSNSIISLATPFGEKL